VDVEISSTFSEDTRNFKGFTFEMLCKNLFEKILNVRYIGNPSNYSNWLQNHNRNSFDGIITYSNGTRENLEMKFVSEGVKIESSWFNRDWLTRDANVIVTNNPTSIKYEDKRKAERLGKKILSVSEALVYLSKKAHNLLHPNQLSSWNSHISNIILELTSTLARRITISKFKIKLKMCLLEIKSHLRARLSKYHFIAIKSKKVVRYAN
jgi:hypothetical protein